MAKFNRAAYEVSDPVKYKVVEYLNTLGCYTRCYEDKSTEDIKVLYPYQIEVEHRSEFIGDKFPYKTISIPYRKLRHKKDNTLFYVVNNEVTYAYIVHSNLLIDEYLVIKNTTRQEKEKFFHVPIEKCKLVKL